jgi:hypothetical protein
MSSLLQRVATTTSWRPPGYLRAHRRVSNALALFGGWRVFRRDAERSVPFQATLRSLRAHDVYYEPKLPRYWQLFQLAEATVVPGAAIAEFGVYRGGTARILADIIVRRAPDAELHLFDTFAGMPSADEYDYAGEVYKPGDLADANEEDVRGLLAIDAVRPVFHVGPFRDTLPLTGPDGELSLTHIDADLYESVLEACEWAYPRTRPGGMIVFDDYAFADCPGASRAIAEYFATRSETPIVLPTGQALVVKQVSGP